jgi:hypothetical protein
VRGGPQSAPAHRISGGGADDRHRPAGARVVDWTALRGGQAARHRGIEPGHACRERFDRAPQSVEARIESVDTCLKSVEARVESVEARSESVESFVPTLLASAGIAQRNALLTEEQNYLEAKP